MAAKNTQVEHTPTKCHSNVVHNGRQQVDGMCEFIRNPAMTLLAKAPSQIKRFPQNTGKTPQTFLTSTPLHNSFPRFLLFLTCLVRSK